MTTTVNLRKLLHRKAWEFATPTINNTTSGSFFAGDKLRIMPQADCFYYAVSASGIYSYNADQDAWLTLPSSGVAGTFAAGACGEFRPLGMMGGSPYNTATGTTTTTTIATNRSIVRNLKGCLVRVVAGTGMGYEGTVVSNTLNANAVITVTPANSVAFDATTVFQIWSGSLWFFNAGTSAVGFSVYDRATNAWTAKSVTNLPTAWGTTGQLVATSAMEGSFDNGTATAGSATTISCTGKTWLVNGFANSQVRITSGTGKGQARVIVSNTATQLTTSSATVSLTAMTRAADGTITATVSAATALNLIPYRGFTISGCADTTFNGVWTILTVSGTTVTLKSTSLVLQATAQTGTGQDSWITNPDATSVFSIEGNDDQMFLMGNNAVTLYKYSLGNNLWGTVSPATARAGAMAGGGTGDWITGVTDADWQGAQGKYLFQSGSMYKQNGRYIYSFRGGATTTLDIYDIAGNTWIAVTNIYGNAGETFTTGSCSVDYGGYIYIQKEASGRIFRFDVANHALEPFATNFYPQSTTVEGDKMIVIPYKDGATTIPFLYTQVHSRGELLRMMMIG